MKDLKNLKKQFNINIIKNKKNYTDFVKLKLFNKIKIRLKKKN